MRVEIKMHCIYIFTYAAHIHFNLYYVHMDVQYNIEFDIAYKKEKRMFNSTTEKNNHIWLGFQAKGMFNTGFNKVLQ